MNYELLNIIADGDTIVAFFRFEDGTEHSNRFPKTTTVMDILAWAKTHGEELVAGREEAKLHAEELLSEITTENNGDILL